MLIGLYIKGGRSWTHKYNFEDWRFTIKLPPPVKTLYYNNMLGSIGTISVPKRLLLYFELTSILVDVNVIRFNLLFKMILYLFCDLFFLGTAILYSKWVS